MKKRIIRIAFVLVVISLVMTPSLYAKKGTTKINLKGFSKFVEQQMKEWEVPGVAIAIVKDGKLVFARGFGYRDVEKKLGVTPDTLFAIGSCSKAFTATLLGILVDEGKLDWDKPVREYLPSFKLEDSFASQQMTPVDLVCHRSGLPRHDLVWYNSPATREELVKRLPYLEPNKGFRSTFQYNNLMFLTAGFLAGKVTNTSWEGLVRKKIFNPLGMKTSNFSVKDSRESPDFSLPYSKRDEKVVEIPFRDITTIGPAGSINSSVNEMSKWVLLNLNKGKIGEKQIVSEGNLQKIHSPQMVTGAALSKYDELFYNFYGMGWIITAYRGHLLVSHGGGIDGFVSRVAFLPRDNAGLVILTNSDTGGNPLCAILASNIYDRILGLPQAPWAKRIKERSDKAKKEAEEAMKKKDTDRKLNTKPSHNLEDYAGDFENPGYGILTIKKDGDQLKATFNYINLNGQHYHYDIFEFTTVVFGEQQFRFSFHTDVKGNISRVSIPFQTGVKDIEFVRMPEKKMKEKEFLKKFVGEYDLHGVTAAVFIKGENTLVLTVPGQPPYELVPYKGTEFTIKKLKEFSIKFIMDESGTVTGLESHQPNGVFTAKKK
jgi:CubicO group peptidase (beta-lactamase class C family)